MAHLVTTLNKIREHSPCKEGWEKLLKHLNKTQADDEELSFLTILDSNGFEDALWCTKSAPQYDKEWRLFVLWCARQVQYLMKDQRSLDALDVAERFANGLASKEELAATLAATLAAAWAAEAAEATTLDAAEAAAWAAAWAAWDAWDATLDAAEAAAWAAAEAAGDAGDAQKEQFIKVISGE